ncbi:MAG: translation initiation factor IF-2 [Deltaproteobacteria bacterium]|nr:MAG: translation initiation factor IF-2 [Deltaproteobacteria bacterium]
MGKKRVYELARDLGIPSKTLIERAQALGYTWIQSHANTLEDNEARDLSQKVSAGGGRQTAKRKSTVLRRRVQRESSGYEVVTTRISDEGAEVLDRKQIEMPVPPRIGPASEPPPAPAVEEPIVEAPSVAAEVSAPVAAPVVEEPKADVPAPVEVEAAPGAPVAEVAEPVAATEEKADTKATTPATAPVSEPVEAAPAKVEAIAEPETPAQETTTTEKTTANVAEAAPVSESSSKPIGEPVQSHTVSIQEKTSPAPAADSSSSGSIKPFKLESQWQDESKIVPLPAQQTKTTNERFSGQQNTGRGDDSRTNNPNDRRAKRDKKKDRRGGGRDEFQSQSQGQGRGRSSRQGNRNDFNDNRRGRKSRKGSKKSSSNQPVTAPVSERKRVIKIEGAISVADLAHRLGVKAAELIGILLRQGVMARINDVIPVEQASELAQSKGYRVEDTSVAVEDILDKNEIPEEEGDLSSRPPVVTVMGHVDHGKTSLLDAIRETRVADQEAGGITQHIGASVVSLKNKRKIVFLDTPGHEAFTAMRSRGAQSTDIVILVVAADDSVMPQTIEAINHSKAAGVPIVVAINKCDKAGADPMRTRSDLMQHGLIPEEYGGENLMVEVSAHTGQGIPELLESVLLQAEILELQANPDRKAQGVVIESRIEKGRGAVATMLVKTGTINAGDAIVAGTYHGRIRAMFDHNNKPIKTAGPSSPVKILGLNGTPTPGDIFDCVDDEKAARQVADIRIDEAKKAEMAAPSRARLQDLWGDSQKKELNIILKTDVEGTLEALKQSLLKLKNEEIELAITHAAVGGITENDINLGSTTGSVVFGFNVRADSKAQRLSESEGIEIRTYRVIYELLDDVKAAMERQLAPTLQERPIGQAEIRKIFTIPKAGKVAGCYVTDGKITRGSLIRLYRDDIRIYEGKVQTLRRFKNDVKEVATGYECGIQIEGYQDIHENDVIEAYEIEEIATKLEL